MENKIIRSVEISHIIDNIKKVQSRMKDPDVKNLQYIYAYDKLGKEFSNFADKYPNIFVMVVRGDDLRTMASTLYYQDKINRGEISSEKVGQLLAKKYIPDHLIDKNKIQ